MLLSISTLQATSRARVDPPGRFLSDLCADRGTDVGGVQWSGLGRLHNRETVRGLVASPLNSSAAGVTLIRCRPRDECGRRHHPRARHRWLAYPKIALLRRWLCGSSDPWRTQAPDCAGVLVGIRSQRRSGDFTSEVTATYRCVLATDSASNPALDKVLRLLVD